MIFSKKNKNHTGESYHNAGQELNERVGVRKMVDETLIDQEYNKKDLESNMKIFYSDNQKISKAFANVRDDDFYENSTIYPSKLDKNGKLLNDPEIYKDFNEEAYKRNSSIILKNIKNQIFRETYRLLYGDEFIEELERRSQQLELNEEYKTNNEFNDKMIEIAANDDKEISESFVNDVNKIRSENQVSVPPAIPTANDDNVNKIDVDKINDEKWKDLRNDLYEYSKISQTIEQNRNAANSFKELNNTNESVNAIPTKPVDINTSSNKTENVNVEVKPINRETVLEMTEPLKSDYIDVDYGQQTRNINNILSQSSPKQWESFKEVAPLINNELRGSVRNLDDSQWEKVKSYVKDFNLSRNAEAVANVNGIIDVDNALKVDLKENFYLSNDQLRRQQELQAREFTKILDEYKDIIKEQQNDDLRKIFNKINEKSEIKFDNVDYINKQEQQNNMNVLAIDENIRLKNQIKDLERRLNIPAPEPKITPKLSRLEMEDLIDVIYPQNLEKKQENLTTNTTNTTNVSETNVVSESNQTNDINVSGFDAETIQKLNQIQKEIEELAKKNETLVENKNTLEDKVFTAQNNQDSVVSSTTTTNSTTTAINNVTSSNLNDNVTVSQNQNTTNQTVNASVNNQVINETKINNINEQQSVANKVNLEQAKNIQLANNQNLNLNIVNDIEASIQNAKNIINSINQQTSQTSQLNQTVGQYQSIINNIENTHLNNQNQIKLSNVEQPKELTQTQRELLKSLVGMDQKTIDSLVPKINLDDENDYEVNKLPKNSNVKVIKPSQYNNQNFVKISDLKREKSKQIIANTLRKSREFADGGSQGFIKSFEHENRGIPQININQIRQNANKENAPANIFDNDKIVSIRDAYNKNK